MSRLINEFFHVPEKIVGYSCDEICDKDVSCEECPIQEGFNKLAHYEDLEEAGRLIELPCKVGDMAYYIDKENKIRYGVVHEITIGQRFCWFTLRREVIVFKDKKGGRTSEFFLTKAEAEAKLAELQSFPTLPILHGNVAPASREEAMERLGLRDKLSELKGGAE